MSDLEDAKRKVLARYRREGKFGDMLDSYFLYEAEKFADAWYVRQETIRQGKMLTHDVFDFQNKGKRLLKAFAYVLIRLDIWEGRYDLF